MDFSKDNPQELVFSDPLSHDSGVMSLHSEIFSQSPLRVSSVFF